MVIETSRPIARMAKELGINEGILGNLAYTAVSTPARNRC
jgi:hypothetical protein